MHVLCVSVCFFSNLGRFFGALCDYYTAETFLVSLAEDLLISIFSKRFAMVGDD